MRYKVEKYGVWWYHIIDNETGLAIRDPNYANKFVQFRDKKEAQKWCDLQNEKEEKVNGN